MYVAVRSDASNLSERCREWILNEPPDMRVTGFALPEQEKLGWGKLESFTEQPSANHRSRRLGID